MHAEFRSDWKLSTGRARNPGRACNGPERHKSIPGTSVPGRMPLAAWPLARQQHSSGCGEISRCCCSSSCVIWVQTTKVELNRCCHRPFHFTCSLPEWPIIPLPHEYCSKSEAFWRWLRPSGLRKILDLQIQVVQINKLFHISQHRPEEVAFW